jgi:hypothetical protein
MNALTRYIGMLIQKDSNMEKKAYVHQYRMMEVDYARQVEIGRVRTRESNGSLRNSKF